MQRCRDVEMQRCRGIEIQVQRYRERYGDIVIQRYRDVERQRYREVAIYTYRDIEIYSDIETQRGRELQRVIESFRDVEMQRCRYIQRYTDTEIQRYSAWLRSVEQRRNSNGVTSWSQQSCVSGNACRNVPLFFLLDYSPPNMPVYGVLLGFQWYTALGSHHDYKRGTHRYPKFQEKKVQKRCRK